MEEQALVPNYISTIERLWLRLRERLPLNELEPPEMMLNRFAKTIPVGWK
jgi:hypothetical protein